MTWNIPEFELGPKASWRLETLLLASVFLTLAAVSGWWSVYLVQSGVAPIPGATPLGYTVVLAPAAASVVCIGTVVLRLTGQLRLWLGCTSLMVALALAGVSMFFWHIVLLVAILSLVDTWTWLTVLGLLLFAAAFVAVLAAVSEITMRRTAQGRVNPDCHWS